MIRLAVTLLWLALASIACTTPRPDGFESGSELKPKTHQTRDLLTRSDLSELGFHSAFQAVRHLRPRWLQSRGPVQLAQSTQDYPQVIIDGMWIGGLEQLHSVPVEGVREMRFLTSGQATLRYGAGFPSGAIEIRMGGI